MHRWRLLLGAVVLLVGVAPALPAAAQSTATSEPAISHAAEECIELLERGEPPQRCQEAPNRILPPGNELVWSSAAFILLLAAFLRFGLPPLRQALATRSERIRASLDDAAAARAEAEAARKHWRAELDAARQAADAIVEDARRQAYRMRDDLIARAHADVDEQRVRDEALLESERVRLLGELRAYTGSTAVGLAEHLVVGNLDRSAHDRLIDSFIDQVAEKNSAR